MTTKDQIIATIHGYIQRNGDQPGYWYVGVSKDARNRLFNDHKVSESKGVWIYRTASTSGVARQTEGYFIKTIGTDGGKGGGDTSAKMVYAYKKTSSTLP